MRTALGVFLASCALAALVSGGAAAQAVAAHDTTAVAQDWGPLTWLIGDWEGSGTTPGVGGGTFSVHPDLDGNILIRKNSAPLAGGAVHQDLMVLYHAGDGTIRAIYFDNERHVINYTVTPTMNPGGGAVLLSDEVPGMPRFRLTYAMTGERTAKILFEMQPPGASEFKPYLEGTATRK